MTSDWETKFVGWSKPPSDTEEQRIENAIRAVRNALNTNDELKPVSRAYLQGSYRNRVNVRIDSDVDIGVLYTGNSFYSEIPEGYTRADFDIIDGDISYSDFKDLVQVALNNHFGSNAVTRGNKAFDIHENTYRVDCDVVPTMVHRRYAADGTYNCGVQLLPDNGGTIVNWPERLYDHKAWPSQHYENGVRKNSETKRAYKGMVRIVKTLQHKMEDQGIGAARDVPGFLIECLVWNTPNSAFAHDTWESDLKAVIQHLWHNTQNASRCKVWGEVSELKYLFKGSPDSKRVKAHAFIDGVWDYVGVGS